jgi:hypothetical protein
MTSGWLLVPLQLELSRDESSTNHRRTLLIAATVGFVSRFSELFIRFYA